MVAVVVVLVVAVVFVIGVLVVVAVVVVVLIVVVIVVVIVVLVAVSPKKYLNAFPSYLLIVLNFLPLFIITYLYIIQINQLHTYCRVIHFKGIKISFKAGHFKDKNCLVLYKCKMIRLNCSYMCTM